MLQKTGEALAINHGIWLLSEAASCGSNNCIKV
jgi:hypothetical protein